MKRGLPHILELDRRHYSFVIPLYILLGPEPDRVPCIPNGEWPPICDPEVT